MIPVEKLINYQIIGEDTSPKLVFLHGIMGQGRNWLSIAKKLSKNYQCLVFDQRGHGKSFHPETGFELDNYVEDLKVLLNHLGWDQSVRLIGHSMGGRVALCFADKYPERVRQLVIVDIGPTSDWDTMKGILEKVNFVPTPFPSRKEARQFMETSFFERYKNRPLMEFFYSNLVDVNGLYDWTFSKKLIVATLEQSRFKDYWAEFKSLAMPTLLIRGGDSVDLKHEDYQKVLQNNSQVAGHVIPGVGHWVHAEKPLETLRIIEQFFNIAAGGKQ